MDQLYWDTVGSAGAVDDSGSDSDSYPSASNVDDPCRKGRIKKASKAENAKSGVKTLGTPGIEVRDAEEPKPSRLETVLARQQSIIVAD